MVKTEWTGPNETIAHLVRRFQRKRVTSTFSEVGADRLAEMGLPGWVEVKSRHILTAELVEGLYRVDRVVFLDAVGDG